jgi:exonuclease III
MHLNICGLWNKIEELKHLLNKHKISIIGLAETHLGPNDEPPVINGYRWHGSNGTRHGKGVGIYSKEKLHDTTSIVTYEKEGRIAAIKCQGLAIIETYAPVDCSKRETKENYYRNLTACLAEIITTSNNVILMGDFNAHIKDFASNETNNSGVMLQNIVKTANMNLINLNDYTYLGRNGRPTCIDYIAISENMSSNVLNFNLVKNTVIGSDHLPIKLELNTNLKKTQYSDTREYFKINLLERPQKRKQYQDQLNQILKNQTLTGEPHEIYEK